MENRPFLISVIVPIYNVELYLKECLDTIIGQTYKNLEIILVDDGSTDSSGDICDLYGKIDNRIKVIHKANGGQVDARKAGLEMASGDYVSYVDSDDWLDIDMFEILLTSMGELHPDVVLYGFKEEQKDKSIIKTNLVPAGYYDLEALKSKIYPHLLYNPVFSHTGIVGSSCTKLVRTDLLQKSQLMVPADIKYGEDQICTVHTMLLAGSALIIECAPYHYRQRIGSVTDADLSFAQCQRLFKHLYNTFLQNADAAPYIEDLYHYIFSILLIKHFDVFLEDAFSDIPFGELSDKRIALYGAGELGQKIYKKIETMTPGRVVLWVDRNYIDYKKKHLPVEPIDSLLSRKFDVVLIALLDLKLCGEIQIWLESIGISREKIRSVNMPERNLDVVKEILLG